MNELSKIDNFVKKYLPFAKQASAMTGIPTSAILGQAALESGWGGSSLASTYNNLFGIKAHGKEWAGDTISLSTTEHDKYGNPYTTTADFRVYDSPLQSFLDWANFLKKYPRYEKAGVFNAKTSYEVADALQRAGYATDAKYADLVKGTISSVEKSQFFNTEPIPTPNIYTDAYNKAMFDIQKYAEKKPANDPNNKGDHWSDWLDPSQHWQAFKDAIRFPFSKEGYEYVEDRLNSEDRQTAGWQTAGSFLQIVNDPKRYFSENKSGIVFAGIVTVIIIFAVVLIWKLISTKESIEE